MRKLFFISVLFVLAVVLYPSLSDPARRKKLLGTIERATGVNRNTSGEEIIQKAQEGSEKILRKLEETLQDPQLQSSVKELGEKTLDKIKTIEVQEIKETLEHGIERLNEKFPVLPSLKQEK